MIKWQCVFYIKRIYISFFCIVIYLISATAQERKAILPTSVRQGYLMKLWMSDNGEIGLDVQFGLPDEAVGCVYPSYSLAEHIYAGGLWVGALIDTGKPGLQKTIKLVTTSDEADGRLYDDVPWETGVCDTAKPWYHTSIWEDSSAVSESDYYCCFTDTSQLIHNFVHKPLGIKVFQRSYAWGNAVRSPVIIMEYEIINLGMRQMRDVYIGIHQGCAVGTTDYKRTREVTNISGYIPELLTGYVDNSSEVGATPIGFTILKLSKPLQEIKYFFRWQGLRKYWWLTWNDSTRYNRLCGLYPPGLPSIQPNQSVYEPIDGGELLFSFGPINDWGAGETLKVAYAIVSGMSLKYTSDNLYNNAKLAQTLYARGYHPSVVLPVPK